MASYREKVRADLDRWIAGGLVAADQRDAILATLPETRRIDAATALAWIGGALLGIAAIAFVSANWDYLPRLARFALVLALFAAAAVTAAWATQKAKPLLANITLTLASLLFGAAVGLTGQIFDITGDPDTACYIAGVAALALALAGSSTGAAIAALAFVALGDLFGHDWFNHDAQFPLTLIAAPIGVWLAWRWRSAPLAHVSALGVIYACWWLAFRREPDLPLLLFFTAFMAGLMFAARWLRTKGHDFASVFYGWFAWGVFVFLVPAGYVSLHKNGGFGGYGDDNLSIPHRIFWLAASSGVVALGRFDQHLMVTFVGVITLIAAIFALMGDLGVNLLSAAGVFLLCAVIALIAGLALRAKAKAV